MAITYAGFWKITHVMDAHVEYGENFEEIGNLIRSDSPLFIRAVAETVGTNFVTK